MSDAAPIRHARATDLPTIAAIYGHAVRHTVATFDVEDPDPAYWSAKLDGPDPLLVATDDDAVIGFAYASAYRPRPAYNRTRETSVYLAPDATGAGTGSRLYRALLERLRDAGMHRAVAVVALPNPASVALHEKFGFTAVGTMHEVGRKFNRWVDVRWYELALDAP